jgi:hypothetical protein
MEKDLKSTQTLIEDALKKISKESGFETLLLFNDEGFPMVQIPSSFKYNKDDFTIVSSMLNDAAKTAENLDSSIKIDEVSIVAQNKSKIVGRIFYVNETRFNLVAMVPAEITHRKFTNKAVRTLSNIL